MTTSGWAALAERSKHLIVDDFERAAYRLMTSQVLSGGDTATRRDYHLVADHLAEFQQVFEPFGIALRHNPQFAYIVARPRHVLRRRMASKAATILILVLADLYHRIRMQGQEGDFGEGVVDLPDLQEAYLDLVKRDLPAGGEMRGLLSDLERWGIVRREDLPGDTQPYRILIQPAIADLVTPEWMTQLEHLGAGRADTPEHEVEDGDVPT